LALSEFIDPKPKKLFLLTNEAIARAALESDAKVAAFYPGSPTSEILDTMSILSERYPDLKMEVASNEKVALETVAGASMAGVRSFSAMKSVGLNVASDAFYSIGYTGVNAGMVVLFADDPQAHSSQSEQDGRYFALTGHVPMLEPSTPQEAYKMIKYAFNLSEKHRMLVLIRTTTRVNHQVAPVEVGEIKRTPFEKKSWVDVKGKYFTLSDTALRLKGEALEKLKRIESEFENTVFNVLSDGEGEVGVITNGISYLYTLEATEILGVKPHILKLGTLYPIPRKIISEFLRKLRKVIVVEELLPFIEHQITVIAKDSNPDLEIIGKESGHFSLVGEYSVPIVTSVFSKVFDVESPLNFNSIVKESRELKSLLTIRKPTFCPGCPHRGTIWSVLQALEGSDFVLSNDIGCYSMLVLPPYEWTDSLLAMGCSQGISSGMQHALKDRVVSFLGDSTFFHAALPGIVNAVHNQHNYTVIILDNSVTAMTGQQPNPGSDFGPNNVVEIDIEAVLKGIGVKNLVTIDAFDPKANVNTIKKVLDKPGFSAIIAKGPCALYNDRVKRRRGVPIIPNEVDQDACRTIYACIRDFYCPAIQMDMDSRKSEILNDLCNGCMNCAKLCPISAIHITEV
jgi:indolepyruvate ferredoxin oxidoreductase alpha subunit